MRLRLIGDYLPNTGERVRIGARGMNESGMVVWRTEHGCGIVLHERIDALLVVRSNCFPSGARLGKEMPLGAIRPNILAERLLDTFPSEEAAWPSCAATECTDDRAASDLVRLAATMSSIRTNFSLGEPLRARSISARSIFCQSWNVTMSSARPAISASRPARPCLPAVPGWSCAISSAMWKPSGLLVPIVPDGPRRAQPTQ